MEERGRRYRIHEVLGEGAFGAVYKAEALGAGNFSKIVALKVLHAQVRHKEAVVARLRDEARMLAHLKHRAIVQVDDLAMLNGQWTVVMEYVEGVDLLTLCEHVRIPQGPALEIVQEVAGALSVAYDHASADGRPLRLLHRDIKPANLRLTPTGEVKVLDFGIARAELPSREAQTQSAFFGTPAYMAPECLDTGPEHASDVYALGATLYELLTGEMLGRTSIREDKHNERIREALQPIPQPSKSLLQDMLAFTPADRPAAREVRQRVRELRRTLDDPWLSDWAPEVVNAIQPLPNAVPEDMQGSILQETEADTFEVPAASPPTSQLPEPSRRSGAVWALGGGMVGMVLAGGLLVLASLIVSGLIWGVIQQRQARLAGPPQDVVITEPPPEEPEDTEVPEATEPAEDTEASEQTAPAQPPTEPVRADPPPRRAPPPPRTASVSAEGEATKVVLIRGSTRITLPGRVEPGTWTVEATFADAGVVEAGQVTVTAGQRLVLECKAPFYRCQ